MTCSPFQFLSTVVALALFSGFAFAQDENVAVDNATEEATVEMVEYTEEEVVYATPETDYSSADVWWGNRSVSHDSHIKFERIDVTRAPMVATPAAGAPAIGKLYFDNAKPSVLRPEGRAELDKAVAYLRATPGVAALLHAENASDDARNAQAIRAYLGENGIAADRITTNQEARFLSGTVLITYGAMNRR